MSNIHTIADYYPKADDYADKIIGRAPKVGRPKRARVQGEGSSLSAPTVSGETVSAKNPYTWIINIDSHMNPFLDTLENMKNTVDIFVAKLHSKSRKVIKIYVIKGIVECKHHYDAGLKDIFSFRPNYHGHIYIETEEIAKSFLEKWLVNHIQLPYAMVSFFDIEYPSRQWGYIHKYEPNEYETKTYFINDIGPDGVEVNTYNAKYMEKHIEATMKYPDSRLKYFDDEDKNKRAKGGELFDDTQKIFWNAVVTARNFFRYYNIKFYGTDFFCDGKKLDLENIKMKMQTDPVFEYHWYVRENCYKRIFSIDKNYVRNWVLPLKYFEMKKEEYYNLCPGLILNNPKCQDEEDIMREYDDPSPFELSD